MEPAARKTRLRKKKKSNSMAKGNFLTTVVRGKLGNMVGYKNTLSNTKEQQAWRGYVAKINNPKTYGQARQRMVMANMVKFYNALKPILQRSWEGVPYGAKSYQKFMAENMPQSVWAGPFVPKGNEHTWPGEYLISNGTLQPITVENYSQNADALRTDIFTRSLGTTIGSVSTTIVQNNTDIKDGDQLTFVCITQLEHGGFFYRYKSVIVDVNSTEQLDTYTPEGQTQYRYDVWGDVYIGSFGSGENQRLNFSLKIPGATDERIVAGAVIQSREGDNGKWLRSRASVWVDKELHTMAPVFSPEGFELAVQSYMSEGASASDWPTEQDINLRNFTQAWVTESFTIGESTVQATVLAATNGIETALVVGTYEGADYFLSNPNVFATSGGNKIPKSAYSGSRPVVNITALGW